MGKGKSTERTPQLVDHVSESSDEEIDEDEAFNSDDERKYGAMFGGKGNVEDSSDGDSDDSSEKSYGDDDSDGIASDDEAEGGDGGQFMLDLLNNLDKKEDDTKKEKEDARKTLAHSTKMKESEFSTAVKASDLTLDQLMGGITDTKGFGSVQKTMKDMATSGHDEDKRLSTTQTPVAKVVSDRAQRKVAYNENVEEISQWTTATKRNREAETLDFRPKERIKMSKDELVGKFEATTDFEKEMAAALEEAGADDEKEMIKNEEQEMFGDEDDEDDLGRNKLSAEEYRKRRGELAKIRALMFYEEQKRHHINKIKSKKYRKIRKKQRMRLKDAEDTEAAEEDDNYAKELEEKNEMERMKERMSLKHRNTSKWAKRVLRRGANVDSDTRKALSEQVRIGDELKRKMQGNYSDSEDDDANLLDKAQALLTEVEEEDPNDTKKKGLFKLDFMQKGLAAQRERAKQEARELLMELEANEGIESDNDQEDDGEEAVEAKKKKKVASSKEMEKVLPTGKMVASSLEFGISNAVSVSGAIDLDADKEVKKSPAKRQHKEIDVKVSNISVDDDVEESAGKSTKVSKRAAEPIREKTTDEESNPWIRSTSDEKPEQEDTIPKSKRNKKKLPSVSKQGIINVADAANVLTGEISDDDKTSPVTPAQSKGGKNKAASNKIASLTQEELVKKAFATISEDDIEEDFEKEKEAMRDRDDVLKKKKQEENKKVSGWGSWAGEGAPAPRPPKKLPKRLQAPEKKIEKRRRKDDGKKNVIISAKRAKKTAKFQIENIPYPYSSREQYERAMAGSMGKEWNVTGAVKAMTRPEILTRAGKMIRPISKKAKVKRPPLAKFK
jgi:U3 small nucleolar RNA-associated protein 14